MKDSKKISSIRQSFSRGDLSRIDLKADPLEQLGSWVHDALESGQPEPSAMQLSTVGLDGRPHARIVLLKGLTGEGLFFYTNYESAKAVEMDSNPAVAALFFWPVLERQVRIEGMVRKINPVESDLYFSERPRESQIGAWASPQSQVVDSPEVLGQLYAKAEQRFEGQTVPRPPFWGGYCILPVSFEFWQGQPARMHHRFKYHQEKGMWQVDQLAP